MVITRTPPPNVLQCVTIPIAYIGSNLYCNLQLWQSTQEAQQHFEQLDHLGFYSYHVTELQKFMHRHNTSCGIDSHYF